MEAKQTGQLLTGACFQGCSSLHCTQKDGKETDFNAITMQMSQE